MSGATASTGGRPTRYSTVDQRRMYREQRERTERQQRQRQQLIERLVQQQRERHLRSFRRPSR